jgi:transcription initiation factor TFIIIB Brf1 subunit/transcription initiation factor TFIIB
MAGDTVMKVSVGDQCAKCPYCGGTEFLPSDDSAAPPHELVCAQCGGYASRKLLIDRMADEAIAPAKKDRH